MTSIPQSNWDAYYSEDEFKIPDFIVNALWSNFERVLHKHLGTSRSGLVVAELGGANSCFYARFRNSFPVAEYHILDNNRLGLDMFAHKRDQGTFLHNVDLLNGTLPSGLTADVVYSLGLIEHFVPADTEKVVDAHFALTRPNGLVLMSFPTPTWAYWSFRRLLEKAGKFPPLFERPITRDEIAPVLDRRGTRLELYRIWKPILTQFISLTRKENNVETAQRFDLISQRDAAVKQVEFLKGEMVTLASSFAQTDIGKLKAQLAAAERIVAALRGAEVDANDNDWFLNGEAHQTWYEIRAQLLASGEVTP